MLLGRFEGTFGATGDKAAIVASRWACASSATAIHALVRDAVALLARLHPLGVIAAGALFGGLEGGAGAMQRTVGVPAAWVRVVEALVILSVLALERGATIFRVHDVAPARDALTVAAATLA